MKLSWPLCPYVDEWLSHTHFVRFWCSGVDSVTLTRKVCDPSALKAVLPQQRSGRSSSRYEASTARENPLTWWAVILWGRTDCTYYCRFTARRGGEKKHLTCTNSGETMVVTKGLKTKHPVSAQLGKLANNVPFPLTNVWQLAFANHSLLTLWCMSWIPTGGYRRSLLTLNLPMTNGVPVNVRFLGRGRGSF